LHLRRIHPYTQALFAAAPRIRSGPRGQGRRVLLQGEIPNPFDLPPGCRFQSRCVHRADICTVGEVTLREVDGSLVRCHFAESMLASEDVDKESRPPPP